MNSEMLTLLQGKEAPDQTVDLEALARHLENIRGHIVLVMCPHGTGGRTDAEQRRHVLQAEAYKTCAASLMAAASAIRTYQAQRDL